MPGTPKFNLFRYVTKPPKLEKSTDRDQNLNQFWKWWWYDICTPNFGPQLSCVLQKMLMNPKIDQVHKVKIPPKLGKSTELDCNPNSPECGQDTSACQILGHSLDVSSRKCLQTPNVTRFCPVWPWNLTGDLKPREPKALPVGVSMIW